VEARRGLSEKRNFSKVVEAARDAQVLDIGAGKCGGFLLPIVGRQIKIFGTNQIADAAAFVGFGDAGPEAVEFLLELVGFVEQDCGPRNQIEDGAVGAGNRRIKLPAGEDVDSAGANGGFDDFFGVRPARADDAFAAEPRVNRGQEMFADRSFGEREQQSLVDRIGRALLGRIELANGLGFVSEELDAQRTIGLGGVNVENAAANRVLARHFDYVGGGVADCVEVR